jgi:hypothetical protein
MRAIYLGPHEKNHGLNFADNNLNAKTLVSGMSTMVVMPARMVFAKPGTLTGSVYWRGIMY